MKEWEAMVTSVFSYVLRRLTHLFDVCFAGDLRFISDLLSLTRLCFALVFRCHAFCFM